MAGIVLAAILVPQGMAYAELAGLPPVTGLYTTIACLVAYAIFGPSKVLVLGPDSSVSPLILAAVAPLVVTGNPESAVALAGMLAVLVGIILIGLGLAKLGFVADLLSREVRVGYLNGLAVAIIVGQLPKLFGSSVDADGFVDEVRQFLRNVDRTNTNTLITGVLVLAVLLVLPRLTTAVPAVLVAIRRRHRRLCDAQPVRHGGDHGRCVAPRSPGAVDAVDRVVRRGPTSGRRRRNHHGVARRHHRHRHRHRQQFRRPARRRG